MPLSSELFSSAAKKAEQLLSLQGYTHLQTKTDEAFGSHLAQFNKDGMSLALMWDGKEEWLRLVAHKPNAHAEEILFRNLRGETSAEHERALDDAITMLHHFVAPHHHDDDDEVTCGGCSHHHH